MPRKPIIEQPPKLKQPYWGMWGYAQKAMKDAGTWSASMRPLLDEYIDCWRLAAEHRTRAEQRPFEENRESGLEHAHDGFKSALAHSARAMALADALGLTPKAQKALAVKADEPPKESDVFQEADELAKRRAAHA